MMFNIVKKIGFEKIDPKFSASYKDVSLLRKGIRNKMTLLASQVESTYIFAMLKLELMR